MPCLSASEILGAWEYSVDRGPAQRVLALLGLCSDESPEQLAALSIGSRDMRLLELYQRLFGPTLDAFAECPACSEQLEYTLAAGDLTTPVGDVSGAGLTLQADGFLLQLRLPDSADLETAGRLKDLSVARRFLMESCIVAASRNGSSVPAGAVPDSLSGEIETRIVQADPQTELLIDLCCSGCGHSWQVLFDIERFLWVKISALAKRLLREVQVLARAYGWREADILSMTAQRRRAYLDLAGA